MILNKFRFRKTIVRNDFTTVFGGVGKRRTLLHFVSGKARYMPKRTKVQQIRRAHQGHCNRIFGTINALRIRRMYGRRPPTPQFRR
jgi:hypothetical protein